MENKNALLNANINWRENENTLQAKSHKNK